MGEYLGRMNRQFLPAQAARGVKDDGKVRRLADGA
jgi:hypothetical protein